MKKIITIIIKFVHKFIHNKLYNKIKIHFYSLYTLWIQNEFKECGNDCFIMPFKVLKGANNILLGNRVSIGSNCVFETYSNYLDQQFYPSITIGSNSNIGDYTHITCINKITIGNNVLMGRRIFITDNAHGASIKELLDMRPIIRPLYSKGPVIIEDNVWIGEMVCIMPGVTIGHGSIIGANAVVTKSIPPYCVAAGNPARIIKQI